MISLISAALLSLTAADHHGHHGSHHASEAQAQSTVAADVIAVDADARTAVVRHDALTELGMGAMTMRFAVADVVDIALFEPGAALTITVVNDEGEFEIVEATAQHH